METFYDVVTGNQLILVDFFATWCGPCQAMVPVIDRFQTEMNGRADVYRIDVDDPDMLEIVRRYNISSVPTLVIFRRGEVLWRRSGLIGYRELREAFDTIEQREHAVYH